MARRGRHRDYRERVLALVEEAEPDVYERLVELRSRNPQAYRKWIRELVVYYPIALPHKVLSTRSAWYKSQHFFGTDVLDEHFYIFRNALRRGNYDDNLEMMWKAEEAGRNRPVFFQLIRDREELLGRPDRPALPEGGGGWAGRQKPKSTAHQAADAEVEAEARATAKAKTASETKRSKAFDKAHLPLTDVE